MSTEAKLISPQKISKEEFGILGDGLIKSKDKEEFKYIPNKIVYPKNLPFVRIGLTLAYSDKSKVEIKDNGDVGFEYFLEKDKNWDILGIFKNTNNFTRFSGKVTAVIPDYLQEK